jgi:hypothetical protein
MASLFVAVYHVRADPDVPANASPIRRAFQSACESSTFPFDLGDDPSFFAASHLKGPVTWGVCRPDVRGQLSPGDQVVFFAAERRPHLTEYKFVATLTVDRFTSHTDLWSDDSSNLSRYLNLLVRPSKGGWEHYEPGLNPTGWHGDWMWRLCERRGLRKSDLVRAGSNHVAGRELLLPSGQPVPVGRNYVVFDHATAMVLAKPVVVATHRAGAPAEDWHAEPRCDELRRWIYGDSRRGLRTRNPQQPHRHFRRANVDRLSWLRGLRSLLQEGN